MNSQEIWLTHSRLTPLAAPNSPYTGYILAWATNKEEYQQKAAQFCAEQGLKSHAQLAPLPILTWFERHGFSAPLLRTAQTLTLHNQIALLKEGELSAEMLADDEAYLIEDVTAFEPFLDIFTKKAVPQALKQHFFFPVQRAGRMALSPRLKRCGAG